MQALPTGDPQVKHLTPVTREEAAELSRGLLTLVERRPWLGNHPLMVAYSKLLLAVSSGTLKTEAPPQEKVEAPCQEQTEQQQLIDSLREEAANLRLELGASLENKRKLENTLVNSPKLVRMTEMFKTARENLRVALELLSETTNNSQSLSRKLETEKKKSEQLEKKNSSVHAKRVLGLRNKLTTTQEQLRAAKDLIKTVEYGSKHPRFTTGYRKTPASCCPICTRLDPDKYEHRDSGHSQTCPFHKFHKTQP